MQSYQMCVSLIQRNGEAFIINPFRPLAPFPHVWLDCLFKIITILFQGWKLTFSTVGYYIFSNGQNVYRAEVAVY